jgi:hypothetical protein
MPAAGGAGSSFDSGLALKNGSFGRLPTPLFSPSVGKSTAPELNPVSPSSAGNAYDGPANLSWSGTLKLTISTAPVFRYHEPSTTNADQFASGLGAVLRDRPSGLLGYYIGSDYSLQVRGTVKSPPLSPAYFIYSGPTMPPVVAAGAGPADLASLFLAEHSLVPQWPYTIDVQTANDLTKVRFVRQFDAPGYGAANLVDGAGERYGLEVDLNGNNVVSVQGLFTVNLDAALYPIISSDQAIRAALAAQPAQPASSTPAPTVQLTQAELVYVLATAGDQSYYEPAILFSGTFKLNGVTTTKRVLVPAVDPSQRS